jgi:hypothetical protein
MYLLVNNTDGVIGYTNQYRIFTEWHECRTAARQACGLTIGRSIFDQPPKLGEATRVAGGPEKLDVTAMHIGVP